MYPSFLQGLPVVIEVELRIFGRLALAYVRLHGDAGVGRRRVCADEVAAASVGVRRREKTS